MRRRAPILLIAVCLAATSVPGHADNRAPSDGAGPLGELAALVGSWRATGSGFETTLTYDWVLDGHMLSAHNDVRDMTGRVVARYRGAYAWDGGREEIVFWIATASGEVHRGHAWWRDGVLWHEAEVSGGRIDTYASALRPQDGRIEYFAAYGTPSAERELLERPPLVYAPADSAPSARAP